MRIVKNPEERRNEILDAAEILFITKGYAKTTINEILQTLGIAKGTLYHYFKSKEELLDAIIGRIISQGEEKAQAILADSTITVHQKIFQILLAQKPDDIKKQHIIQELHESANAEFHQKSLGETIRRIAPLLALAVEEGNATGDFACPFPLETSEILFVAGSFLFDEAIFSWTEEEADRKKRAFIYVAELSLGARPGSMEYMGTILEQPDVPPVKVKS